MQRKLLTTGEAAKRLGTDVQNVRRWVDRNLLSAVRHPTSHSRLIRVEDVDALKEKLEELAV